MWWKFLIYIYACYSRKFYSLHWTVNTLLYPKGAVTLGKDETGDGNPSYLFWYFSFLKCILRTYTIGCSKSVANSLAYLQCTILCRMYIVYMIIIMFLLNNKLNIMFSLKICSYWTYLSLWYYVESLEVVWSYSSVVVLGLESARPSRLGLHNFMLCE